MPRLLRIISAVLMTVFLMASASMAQTPENEVRQALVTLIKLLEAGKLKEFVETATPPQALKKATPAELKKFMAHFEKDQGRILKMLKQTLKMKMRFNDQQTVAKFGLKGGLDHEISFHNIQGKWYLR